jgi:hypothetical protein
MGTEKSWAQGSLAGVTLDVNGDPIKCFIDDGAGLKTTRWVNQRQAADGATFTQGVDTGGKGTKFGLFFEQFPLDKFDAVVEAINSSLDSTSGFQVTLQDDFHQIDAECTVDGTGWLKYPRQQTNETAVSNVEIRLRIK